MKKLSVLIVFMLTLHGSLAFANDPKGWATLKQTIEKTPFSEVSKLLNRTFDLEVEGATKDYVFTVQPESAFTIERIESNKFRVTIISAEALVKRDLIVEYHPIGWSLKKEDPFKPIITGEASCLYNVVFSQAGVGELDLSKFDGDYDVTYELSAPETVSSVSRAGKGYDIVRTASSISESEIRLRIKKKIGDFNLQTDWIKIPLCKSGNTQTPTTSTPTPVDPEIPAKDFLDIKISGISFCQESTGLYCSTLAITATNKGNSRVKCNKVWFYMKYDNQVLASDWVWVDLLVGQTHTFDIVLKAAYKPQNRWTYNIEKTDCFYK